MTSAHNLVALIVGRSHRSTKDGFIIRARSKCYGWLTDFVAFAPIRRNSPRLQRLMDIRQLRYFVGVANAGSVTKAADTLHVAQPALSQQILKLESALGQRLMLRHSRGISLTEAGSRLLEHARFILEQVDKAEADVADLGGQPRGIVRVGMPRSASDLFGMEMLVRARRLYPDLRIAVVDRLSEELSQLLAHSELDLCLTFAVPEPGGVESQALYTENLCLAVPTRLRSRSARRRTVQFSQLSGFPLALPTVGHGLRTLVDRIAMERNVALDVRFELDSVQLLRDTVARNLACIILPVGSLLEQANSGSARILLIEGPPVARILYLVRSLRRPASKAVMAVRDVLMQSARGRIANPAFAGFYESVC